MRIFMNRTDYWPLSSYALHRILMNLISRIEKDLHSLEHIQALPLSPENQKHHSMARVYLTAAAMELSKMQMHP